MKETGHKHIRQTLEQMAKQHKTSRDERAKRRADQAKRLGLNWKDVVIFSWLMLFTTLYQVQVNAQEISPSSVDFDDITSGMMMSFDSGTGEYQNLQLLSSEYEVDVFGLLATIQLKQRFYNDQDGWVAEGVYAFPMADKSAVYGLKMTVGERVIEGEIHEKKQAQQIYDQAKAEGLTATIVKQHRPNVFTSEIANIGPEEVITVEITYQMSLRYDQLRYELRLPMAVKTRYIPADYESHLPTGMNVADLGQRMINVHLDAGFELNAIQSLHHNVDISQNFSIHQISLQDQQLYDANDFVLQWEPKAEQTPKAAYFSEQIDGHEYGLLMVLPPNVAQKSTRPRNMTFIMDTSGSMHGLALEQSKDALLYALSELDDKNHFNVIDFDSTAKALFPGSRPATPENISQALDFVDGFSSDGGTNMSPALQIAMQRENLKSDHLNQIIFMTDGSVGNEAQLFDQIAQDIGDARLFTIAIGPAPNNYFMSKAAMFGKGTYTHIAHLDQVNAAMSHLFAQLARPAMTDVDVTWNLADVQQSPSVIPDLYMDQPLVITTRAPIDKSLGSPAFVVSGLSGQKSWSEQLSMNDDDRTTGIARLWARNQVEEWTDEMMLGGAYDLLRDQIIELALKHHLITDFTSLVAVDRNPAASRQAQAKAAQQVPFPQGSLGWRWQLMMGLLLILAAQLLWRRV